MIININKNLVRNCLFWVSCFLLFISLLFCIWYLAVSRNYLIEWYMGLNNCFYKSNVWTNEVFKPETKATGNYFCFFGLLLSMASYGYLIYKRKNTTLSLSLSPTLSFKIKKADQQFVAPILIISFGLWLWGTKNIAPAFDEVFSAVNCAGIHPFQSLSYYMLPNNHIGFNFVNGILFHFAKDKVFTGRLISLIAYFGISISIYMFFLKTLTNNWLSIVSTLLVLIQFPVWGFSYQARGYEWYALAGIICFITLYFYILEHKKVLLYINTAALIIGYFFIPTFFYMHLAQIVFMGMYQLLSKKTNL